MKSKRLLLMVKLKKGIIGNNKHVNLGKKKDDQWYRKFVVVESLRIELNFGLNPKLN